MSDVENKVQNVEDDMPEMEDVPELESQPAQETAAATQPATTDAPQKRVSKMEKKNKKALLKSGLKEFPGVTKVSIQTVSKIALAIDEPDVFRSNDTYVIFGIPRVEDSKSQQTKNVLQNILSQQQQAAPATAETTIEEETVDAEGIQEKDIEVVMKEANVSRAAAIKAIKENNGDVVDAVVALSGSA